MSFYVRFALGALCPYFPVSSTPWRKAPTARSHCNDRTCLALETRIPLYSQLTILSISKRASILLSNGGAISPTKMWICTSKKIHAISIATTSPGMSTSREGAVWADHLPPLVLIGHINEEIVEEGSKGSIIVFAPKHKDLLAARGRTEDGSRGTTRRWITD